MCFLGLVAIIMFAELLIVLRRAFTFTAGRIVQVIVCAFISAVCLDWTAGFDFFKDTIAPLVLRLLRVTPS